MAVTNRLTALAVNRLRKPGRHADGGNLYLQISEGGGKSWLFRFMLDGRSREMGLGPADLVSLAEARDSARECRKLLLNRVDPIEHRKQKYLQTALEDARAVTFEECAQEFIGDQRAGWKNAKHADQWMATLTRWAFPVIGKLPVDGITTDLVLKVLKQPIEAGEGAPAFWNARTETASRVRGRIESILDWARARKLRRDGENPARWKGSLDKLLPSKSQVAPVVNHPALPYKQMPEFWRELSSRPGVGARALQFTILTTARTGETVGAKWSELDLVEKFWTVPKERLKGKKGARRRDHVVPLTENAMRLLERITRQGDYVFSGSNTDEPLSTAAMAAVIARINEDREKAGLLKWIDPQQNGREIVPHGFRSTFKDWAAERTDFPNELSELALSHTVSDRVEAAYRRGDMLERRRRMMSDWADFCTSTPRADQTNVVSIRA